MSFIKTMNIKNELNKISFFQLVFISIISFVFLMLKNYEIFSGLLISAGTSFLYTQLLRLSSYNQTLSLFGFPIRLILTALPCAILVHKFHSNLIALFIGFALSQVIYFIFIWSYVKRGGR